MLTKKRLDKFSISVGPNTFEISNLITGGRIEAASSMSNVASVQRTLVELTFSQLAGLNAGETVFFEADRQAWVSLPSAIACQHLRKDSLDDLPELPEPFEAVAGVQHWFKTEFIPGYENDMLEVLSELEETTMNAIEGLLDAADEKTESNIQQRAGDVLVSMACYCAIYDIDFLRLLRFSSSQMPGKSSLIPAYGKVMNESDGPKPPSLRAVSEVISEVLGFIASTNSPWIFCFQMSFDAILKDYEAAL